MLPTPPRGTPGSNEELLATQARLYRLLVEATDRLQKQRGLPRTRIAEIARLNGLSSPSESSDDVSDNGERKGST
jgi:AcrR family transcriptional regulator